MKKSYLKTVVMLVMLVAVAGFAVNASAQEASAEDAPQESVQKMTFGQMLKQDRQPALLVFQ